MSKSEYMKRVDVDVDTETDVKSTPRTSTKSDYMLKPQSTESLKQGRVGFNISKSKHSPSRKIEGTPEELSVRMEQVLIDANNPADISDGNITSLFNSIFPESTHYAKISAIITARQPYFNQPYGTILSDDGETVIKDYLPIEYLERILGASDDVKRKIISKMYNKSASKESFLIELNKLLFINKKGGMSYEENDDDYSTSDDELEDFVDEYGLGMWEQHMQNGGSKKDIKKFIDEKIVMPYLLGGFVNGEIDTLDKVSKLKNEHTRRHLFKSLV